MNIKVGGVANETLSVAKAYSESKVATIRKKLEQTLGSPDKNHEICILTTGSFAREEASPESDIDLFAITDNKESPVPTSAIEEVIKTEVPKDPGSTDTFGPDVILPFENIINNLGGTNDDNQSLTRRMLLLLEGTHLYNKKYFDKCRKKLIETYIKDGISNHQISRFFLNDIIRYYRTIATDFEYKVTEDGKSWGLRNVKLLFSRKLLYFCGIIVVAETYNKNRNEKVDLTFELLNMSPLNRIKHLSNGIETGEIFNTYANFLESISQKTLREILDSVDRSNRNENAEFVRLKELGLTFSKALSKWLVSKYEKEHPIHQGV